MMQTYIPTEEKLEEAVQRAVDRAVSDRLPEVIRKATRKKWVSTKEATEYLDISRRHLQYLRDSEQIPYSQHGRTIRFNVDDLDAFLNRNKIEG